MLLMTLLPACAGLARDLHLTGRKTLSYAQYRSLERGMTGTAILKSFGRPTGIAEKNDAITTLVYPCENSLGETTTLRLGFDAQGRLASTVLAPVQG